MVSPEAAVIKAGVTSFEIISKYELGVLPLIPAHGASVFRGGGKPRFL